MNRVVEVVLPEALLKKIKEAVEKGEFATISEAVRAAIRAYF